MSFFLNSVSKLSHSRCLDILANKQQPEKQDDHPSTSVITIANDESGSGGDASTRASTSPTTITPQTTTTQTTTSYCVQSPSPPQTECYACTQVGIPVFHSTSCDRANQPEWQALAGSSLFHNPTHPSNPSSSTTTTTITTTPKPTSPPLSITSLLGPILDPRSDRVRRWNRAILLARGLALAVDPVFFYSLSVVPAKDGSHLPCLAIDGWLALVLTLLRTSVDAIHLCHVWLEFRLAYVSKESLVIGCGKLVWDSKSIATHYVKSVKRFWFDLFVILPIPQIVFLSLVPKLIEEERIKLLTAILLLVFLSQFLPKVLHSLSLMRRMQKVTGYIFGTIWWGFGLNLLAYFIASHAVGGCWYILSIQRVASCLAKHCGLDTECKLFLSCSEQSCSRFIPVNGSSSVRIDPCLAAAALHRSLICLEENGAFRFGIYGSAVPVIKSKAIVVKILYPISWGLFQLSTFGNNLAPTSHWSELLFCIIVVLGGLMLFTLLIGNIQVFLHTVMSNSRKMQLRCRDMEWWMKRRQFPSRLRRRVRQFERHRWVTSGAVDEMELIKDLPEGLRRDIKRYLCLDLIKKVPLFHCLEDLILDNICDRVKPLIYSKHEKILREGDPVQRMVFIVKGKIKSTQKLSRGNVATTILEPGSFLGDELLSWCLRRPFIHRLPASSATFTCMGSTEGFGLDAYDLRFITEHFRYKFANENMKRTLRYHSSNWRTWAAVNIQIAWRRCVKRRREREMVGMGSREISVVENGENWLRHFAAIFMSIRPHDHLE